MPEKRNGASSKRRKQSADKDKRATTNHGSYYARGMDSQMSKDQLRELGQQAVEEWNKKASVCQSLYLSQK